MIRLLISNIPPVISLVVIFWIIVLLCWVVIKMRMVNDHHIPFPKVPLRYSKEDIEKLDLVGCGACRRSGYDLKYIDGELCEFCGGTGYVENPIIKGNGAETVG